MLLRHQNPAKVIYKAVQFLLAVITVAASIRAGTPNIVKEGADTLVNKNTHIPTDLLGKKWSYVTVRPGVHMFWWYYPCRNSFKTKSQQIPLVIWLQGGPGEAASGMGNFLEIGPYDMHWRTRNTTWANKVHLLFIDSPVGTGFSYADNLSLYARDEHQIATDLFSVLRDFYSAVPDMHQLPLYIFGQSYGGKMAVSFASLLTQAIADTRIQCNLTGIGLFDPLISPIDTVTSYIDYYKAFSLMDDNEAKLAHEYVYKITQLINKQQFDQASTTLIQLLTYIVDATGLVDVYNVLRHVDHNPFTPSHRINNSSEEVLLSQLMNGPIRNALGNIPQNLTWYPGNGQVYQILGNDIMQSVTDKIDGLLSDNITVAVFTGQFDGLTNTIGTQAWIDKLKWSDLYQYQQIDKVPIYDQDNIIAFTKNYKQFSYHWILNAGHYAIRDAPDTTFTLFQKVIGVL
ncbi:Retinoid-inducible serine carboxypeptidase [Trichoplax sp. H2]|nr:Retinoid-inducible serine carboxypeptidase [Trichoplax sp. H2]|eukprot:RDD47821.1 Retinoid-inducible serine carboxypeptidase [Trichoplax sp. H2]